jgi:hypothetical protein
MNKKMKSRSWFVVGVLSAATFGALASIPSTGSTAGTMAPTQDVSEIRSKRQVDLAFDQDLKRLSSLQGRYRENLPLRKQKSIRPVKKSGTKSLSTSRVRAKIGQR